MERSRVRAPYAGRINKRLITKGSYLEERTPIATIADLSRIRLVGYVPETAAPVVRDLLRQPGAAPRAPPGSVWCSPPSVPAHPRASA